MRDSGHDLCERTAFTYSEQASCAVLKSPCETGEPMLVKPVSGSSGDVTDLVPVGGINASRVVPESEAA